MTPMRDQRRHARPPLILTLGIVIATAVYLVMPSQHRSVESMFVATTEAAEASAGAMCMMPDVVGEPAQAPIAVPARSDLEGGDLQPVRMVVDPYPSFNGVVVD